MLTVSAYCGISSLGWDMVAKEARQGMLKQKWAAYLPISCTCLFVNAMRAAFAHSGARPVPY